VGQESLVEGRPRDAILCCPRSPLYLSSCLDNDKHPMTWANKIKGSHLTDETAQQQNQETFSDRELPLPALVQAEAKWPTKTSYKPSKSPASLCLHQPGDRKWGRGRAHRGRGPRRGSRERGGAAALEQLQPALIESWWMPRCFTPPMSLRSKWQIFTLGSKRLKIFGRSQMRRVSVPEILAKGVI
jgi:hypothetical protein